MISITGETGCWVLKFNFWLCYVMIFALAYTVEHFFEPVEFKLHSLEQFLRIGDPNVSCNIWK